MVSGIAKAKIQIFETLMIKNDILKLFFLHIFRLIIQMAAKLLQMTVIKFFEKLWIEIREFSPLKEIFHKKGKWIWFVVAHPAKDFPSWTYFR